MLTHGRRWLPFALTILCAFLIAAIAAMLAPLPGCTIGARDDIGCARGFQTREGDRRPFRWSDDHAWVVLPGVGWAGPQALSITLAAPRPAGLAQPKVTLAVAGLAANFTVPSVVRRYTLLAPAPTLGADTLALSIHSETFVPPGDGRDLGVAIYTVQLLPTTALRLPGLLPLFTLAIIALALIRLSFVPGQSQPTSLFNTVGRAYVGSLLLISILAVLWVMIPMRVAPFLPGLAAILVLAAWLLPQFGFGTILWTVWLAACCGAALDAILVTNLVQGQWIVLILMMQVLQVVWSVYAAYSNNIPIGSLLIVALLLRTLAFATRLLSGNAAVDPDTELFYNYGRATLELGVPLVEYPSGALIVWALLALSASRELFALLLPIVNIACDLAIVWGIATIARSGRAPADSSRQALSGALACCYALTPLLLPFWHGKYDSLPAALTIVGLALFAQARFSWSGATLALGGTIKWVPWLTVPILGWQLLRTISTRQRSTPLRWPILSFSIGFTLAVLAASLPFALSDWQAFLTPYTVQGARPLIGESLWFLPAAFFEPELLSRLSAPWSGTQSMLFTPIVTLAAQVCALLALGFAAVLRPIDLRRTLALAALAPAAFLLLNRVYSPQYALPIAASLLCAGAAVLNTRRDVLVLVAALACMQAANLMVWPYTRDYWLLPSAVQFAAGIGATIWLAIRAGRGVGGFGNSPAQRAE